MCAHEGRGSSSDVCLCRVCRFHPPFQMLQRLQEQQLSLPNSSGLLSSNMKIETKCCLIRKGARMHMLVQMLLVTVGSASTTTSHTE